MSKQNFKALILLIFLLEILGFGYLKYTSQAPPRPRPYMEQDIEESPSPYTKEQKEILLQTFKVKQAKAKILQNPQISAWMNRFDILKKKLISNLDLNTPFVTLIGEMLALKTAFIAFNTIKENEDAYLYFSMMYNELGIDPNYSKIYLNTVRENSTQFKDEIDQLTEEDLLKPDVRERLNSIFEKLQDSAKEQTFDNVNIPENTSKIISIFNDYLVDKLPADATSEQIKKAYRALALMYHPDKSDKKDTEDIMKIINGIYATRNNFGKRRLSRKLTRKLSRKRSRKRSRKKTKIKKMSRI